MKPHIFQIGTCYQKNVTFQIPLRYIISYLYYSISILGMERLGFRLTIMKINLVRRIKKSENPLRILLNLFYYIKHQQRRYGQCLNLSERTSNSVIELLYLYSFSKKFGLDISKILSTMILF